jgi:transposase-like protein
MASKENSQSAESLVRDNKRKTKRVFNAEEEIRIVIEGMRGESSIAELCRKEGIHPTMYYKWSKDFMEAGKKRLNGDTVREATSTEVQQLRSDNEQLKQLFADVIMDNRNQKKSEGFGIKLERYMKYTPEEKYEIIRIVEESDLGVKRTLRSIGISKSTFYLWYHRYLESGLDGLKTLSRWPQRVWNQLSDDHRLAILEFALEYPELSS